MQPAHFFFVPFVIIGYRLLTGTRNVDVVMRMLCTYNTIQYNTCNGFGLIGRAEDDDW